MKPANAFSWLRRHWIISCIAASTALVFIIALWIAGSIMLACYWDETRKADAAIVLGAAVYNDEPSPVFLERIRHGVNLYNQGIVKKLVFTGGKAEGDSIAEAEAARAYATANGVAPEDVLVETTSTTTWQNFTHALPVMDGAQIKTVLVVSDPMHMRRSVAMAHALGIEAYASPTPSTRYIRTESKWHFLKHEFVFYIGFLGRRITGRLNATSPHFP